jgi:Fe-S-cluster containining protein
VTQTDEFLCVRCARQRKTCCQVSEIHVTLGDVRRIAAHTGQTDFHEFRLPDNPSYADQDDDPLWRDNVFQPDGSRRVLLRRPDGDCTFLGQAGCVLPLEVRPLVCRLYPFEYTADGITDDLSTGCPLELLAPGQHLIAALDMHIEDARRWQKQLYAEIQEKDPADADRPDVRPAL